MNHQCSMLTTCIVHMMKNHEYGCVECGLWILSSNGDMIIQWGLSSFISKSKILATRSSLGSHMGTDGTDNNLKCFFFFTFRKPKPQLPIFPLTINSSQQQRRMCMKPWNTMIPLGHFYLIYLRMGRYWNRIIFFSHSAKEKKKVFIE